MNDAPSLVDRFFWPAVVMATLVLGGFVTVVYKTVTRSAAPVVVAATPTLDTEKVTPPALDNTMPVIETPKSETAAVVAELKTQAENGAAEVAAVPKADEPAKPVVESVAVAPKPKTSDDDSPYVVPGNKPFISSSDFGAPKTQAQPKRPVKPLPPVVPAKPAVAAPKTVAPPAPPAMVKPATADSSKPISAFAMPHTPVYVLKDGRKIPAIKVVDLGESYGLKSASGQIVTVLKDDVINIEK